MSAGDGVLQSVGFLSQRQSWGHRPFIRYFFRKTPLLTLSKAFDKVHELTIPSPKSNTSSSRFTWCSTSLFGAYPVWRYWTIFGWNNVLETGWVFMTYHKAATLFRLTFDSTCQFSRKATLCTSVHLLTSSSCFSNSHVVFALCYQLLSARTPVLRPMVSVFGTSAMLSTGVMATHSSRLRQPLYSARKSMASTSGPHHVPGVTKQVCKSITGRPHLWELLLTLSFCWKLNKNIVHIALLRSEMFVASN